MSRKSLLFAAAAVTLVVVVTVIGVSLVVMTTRPVPISASITASSPTQIQLYITFDATGTYGAHTFVLGSRVEYDNGTSKTVIEPSDFFDTPELTTKVSSGMGGQKDVVFKLKSGLASGTYSGFFLVRNLAGKGPKETYAAFNVVIP